MAQPNKFQMIFMDAGQGDATLIVRPDGQLILVDCGSKKNKNVVSEPIWRTLQDNGIEAKGLLALILTHPDSDHYNLVQDLLIKKNIKITNVYYGGVTAQYSGASYGLMTWLLRPGAETTVHSLGFQHFDHAPRPELSNDDLQVRIVAANVGGWLKTLNKNLNSIVVFISVDSTNFLLMGDSFIATEQFIIARDDKTGGPLKTLLDDGATVLKAGHHGSDTSTGDQWVNWAKPTAAFISSDTQLFSGSSTCVASVIERILGCAAMTDGAESHNYVQYNKISEEHELKPTTSWFFTTLDNLKFDGTVDSKKRRGFMAEGKFWYYTIEADGEQWVGAGEGEHYYTKPSRPRLVADIRAPGRRRR